LSFPVACVIISTEATEEIDPRKETIELQPVFKKGYILIETAARARPNVKNSHITLYAGENQNFFKRGTTDIRFPRTYMMLLCTRYQKSASPVLPVSSLFIEMAKAL
jgi:hypothetical protein